MKGIFTANENFRKSAFMNWRIKKYSPILNMMSMADGYMRSALMLANNSVKNNKDNRADILIFPILNNVNHGIELYLKALISTLNELLKNGNQRDGGHDIKRLLEIAQARMKDLKGDKYLNEFNKGHSSLIEYIDELFGLIATQKNNDNMDFSRYTISSKGENHFYVETIENVTIDLPNFIARFKEIHQLLGQVTDYFYHVELDQWK